MWLLFVIWFGCLLMAFAEVALGGGRLFMDLTGHLTVGIFWYWVMCLVARILGATADRSGNAEKDKKSD